MPRDGLSSVKLAASRLCKPIGVINWFESDFWNKPSIDRCVMLCDRRQFRLTYGRCVTYRLMRRSGSRFA